MKAAILATMISVAGPLAADPFLALPLDCIPGQSCFIEDYVDIAPGPAVRDFACGPKARQNHRGTDFALPGMDAMKSGVAVRAAADGRVVGTRDGMADKILTPDETVSVAGRECGNGVRIAHENGYSTLYCHLARGSLAVAGGNAVMSGDLLGLVGLSGQTTFPHLHLTVLDEDGTPVDPFSPHMSPEDCGPMEDTLWLDPPPYTPTGFATASFTTGMPDLAAVRDGSARAPFADLDDALIVYARLFHAKPGDVLHLSATGPDGALFDHSTLLREPEVDLFRAFGRRAPDAGWPLGDYAGEARLMRGDRLVAARQAHVTVSR